MSYRLLTPNEKAINRYRAMQHLCWLLGPSMYMQFCHVHVHDKVDGRYTWKFPQERDQFFSTFTPVMEHFAQRYYTEGKNPDNLDHPVRIALEWHNGRRIKDAFLKAWPEKAKMLPMVKARCDKLGITLNVPESEWTI